MIFLAWTLIFISAFYISHCGNIFCYYENWSNIDLNTFEFDVCTHIFYAFIGLNWDGTIKNFAPGGPGNSHLSYNIIKLIIYSV